MVIAFSISLQVVLNTCQAPTCHTFESGGKLSSMCRPWTPTAPCVPAWVPAGSNPVPGSKRKHLLSPQRLICLTSNALKLLKACLQDHHRQAQRRPSRVWTEDSALQREGGTCVMRLNPSRSGVSHLPPTTKSKPYPVPHPILHLLQFTL